MFKVLILVCAMGIAPQDCERDNALDVIVGPAAANELACGFSGQAYLAGTTLAPTDSNYVKIRCTRAASVDHGPIEPASATLASSRVTHHGDPLARRRPDERLLRSN
jgi:hypothetical protein